jgi:hypothetical protein
LYSTQVHAGGYCHTTIHSMNCAIITDFQHCSDMSILSNWDIPVFAYRCSSMTKPQDRFWFTYWPLAALEKDRTTRSAFGRALSQQLRYPSSSPDAECLYSPQFLCNPTQACPTDTGAIALWLRHPRIVHDAEALHELRPKLECASQRDESSCQSSTPTPSTCGERIVRVCSSHCKPS